MSNKINSIGLIFLVLHLFLSGCSSSEPRIINQITQSTAFSPPEVQTRTLQHIVQDSKLSKAIYFELRHHPSLKQESQIRIITFNQDVYIIGAVSNKANYIAAGNTVRIDNESYQVKSIHNKLLIAPQNYNSQDMWLEAKIKAALVSSRFTTSYIQVICDSRTVYLIGQVPKNELYGIENLVKSNARGRKVLSYLSVSTEK
tara:strand:+ start:6843 stop:7445 length:603 start_codon:yes stop_codon:yes gene_type:complete